MSPDINNVVFINQSLRYSWEWESALGSELCLEPLLLVEDLELLDDAEDDTDELDDEWIGVPSPHSRLSLIWLKNVSFYQNCKQRRKINGVPDLSLKSPNSFILFFDNIPHFVNRRYSSRFCWGCSIQLSLFDIQFFSHGSNLLFQDHVFQSRFLLHFQDGWAKLGMDFISFLCREKEAISCVNFLDTTHNDGCLFQYH